MDRGPCAWSAATPVTWNPAGLAGRCAETTGFGTTSGARTGSGRPRLPAMDRGPCAWSPATPVTWNPVGLAGRCAETTGFGTLAARERAQGAPGFLPWTGDRAHGRPRRRSPGTPLALRDAAPRVRSSARPAPRERAQGAQEADSRRTLLPDLLTCPRAADPNLSALLIPAWNARSAGRLFHERRRAACDQIRLQPSDRLGSAQRPFVSGGLPSPGATDSPQPCRARRASRRLDTRSGSRAPPGRLRLRGREARR